PVSLYIYSSLLHYSPPAAFYTLSLHDALPIWAAVSVDNARRYAREHAMAVTLQRSLLPRALPEQNALDVAHRYLPAGAGRGGAGDRKSTRLNSSHVKISYAVFCLKKKKKNKKQ